jgi:hypothetical protein
MKNHALRQNPSTVVLYVLSAISLLLLMSCVLPYSPSVSGVSSPMDAITEILNNPALRIPVLLAGLALLLAGLWLAELIIALPGFVIGAVVGAGIGTAASDGHFGILSILLAILGGALGAWLALALFFLGVFISGFAIGFVVGGSIGNAVFPSQGATTTVGIILGILAGILAVALWQFLQIVISSGVGTALIGVSLGISDQPVWLILIWLFGIVVQSGLLKIIGPPKRTARPIGATEPRPPSGTPPLPPAQQG